MRENCLQKRKKLQNGALNLAEIQHQNRYGNHLSSGFPQFGRNQSHAAFTLCQTELALHFHALTLIPIVLSLGPGCSLLRAT